jgi:hypothetical protein
MSLTRRTATVELSDGRIEEVRVTNPDTIRYEQTAQRHGWPGMTVKDGVATVPDMNRKITFETWAALRRENKYDGSYEQFESKDCVDIDVSEEDVNPTRPDPDSGLSPKLPGLDAGLSQNSKAPMTS